VRSRHFRAKGLLRAALEAQLGQAESDLFDFGGEHCGRIVAAVLARL
jgi:RNA polymerase sigma-70 factor (ECF subfamily)